MGVNSRLLAVLAGSVLLLAMTPGSAQARPASGPAVVTITSSSQSYEYYQSCSNNPPYSCTTLGTIMGFNVFVSNTPGNRAISVTYQIVAGTATAGVDYTGSATGTISVAPGYPGAVQIPIVNDGVAEPAETLSVHFTGASVPADLTAVGNGTILDGGNFPADCTFSRTATAGSFTCTAPACQPALAGNRAVFGPGPALSAQHRQRVRQRGHRQRHLIGGLQEHRQLLPILHLRLDDRLTRQQQSQPRRLLLAPASPQPGSASSRMASPSASDRRSLT